MAAEELGKYKMVLQAIAIQGLLINYAYFHVDFFAVGMFVLWISMAVSIWSGVDYYLKAERCAAARIERRRGVRRFDKALAGDKSIYPAAEKRRAGVAQLVERVLAKHKVVGSKPITRSS